MNSRHLKLPNAMRARSQSIFLEKAFAAAPTSAGYEVLLPWQVLNAAREYDAALLTG